MNFERIVGLLKRDGNSKLPSPILADPAVEFPHPENASLLARWKEDSKIADPKRAVWARGGYEVQSHPDLIEILHGLVINKGIRKGYAYGRAVLANENGLIFGYTIGTHYLFFKVREDKIDDVRRDGGRWDPTYGGDWIEFRVGGRSDNARDWREAVRHWANISYQDSSSFM